MTNTELWDRVFVTDPDAVKPITGKDYSGNSPKPYWIIQRLTQEFGPCGIGWGYTIDSERFELFSDTDCLHVAKVTLWYEFGARKGEVTQMGQTKASYVTSKGVFKLDEDAPKKSVTDALVKCASYLGFAGDIFSGRWDDSKYVASAREHWHGKEKLVLKHKPTSLAKGPMTDQQHAFVAKVSSAIAGKLGAGEDWGAYEELTSAIDLIESRGGDADLFKIALWDVLEAPARKALESMEESSKQQEQ